MKNTKYKINLSVEEKEELNRLVRKQSVSQNIAKRARLILLVAEEKLQHIEISKKVGIVQSQLPQWIKRWQEANKETEVEER